jgi:hypothetical protein
MKPSAIRLLMLFQLLSVLVLPCLGQAWSEKDIENNATIKGIQKISGQIGVAYTRTAVYFTADNGAAWTRFSLVSHGRPNIAALHFSSKSHGVVILHDSMNGNIIVAETLDGGDSWAMRQTPSDLFGEDTHLDDADVRFSSNRILMTLPLATSSNFIGAATFASNDGGSTWRLVSRSVRKRYSDEVKPVESGDWTLRASGTCADTKRGCVQETRLLDGNDRDITPPEIIGNAAMHREEVRRSSLGESILFPPGGSVRTSLNRGFDKCTAGTIAQMQTWWDFSPLYDSNIYISGRNRGCSQPQLTAIWVNQVSSMGWGLIPTIVGYQSPCSVCTTCAKHSFDSATAETQGRGEADIAVNDAANLGLTAGSILYYDMERYDETVLTPGCRTATTSFLKGWTERIVERGYRSGTYGSPRNAIDDWQFMPPQSRMEAVWMARWDNVPSVWTYVSFSNFPANVWNNHQRIKQWQAPHDETWGGVTFNIDGNIADGPVAGVSILKNKNADFDGDRKADISVFRPSNGVWYVRNSSNSGVSFTPFGLGTDVISPGDYDGDGRTDHTVFRPSDGTWHMLTKAGVYSVRAFGQNGDIPAAGDYNGDGKTDVAVFRPSNGVWYIANSDSLGTFTYISWGLSGDKPVTGDYDGDGKSDAAVYRPSEGAWYALRSSDGGFMGTSFGLANDLPAQGDFDGDGKTDICVYRPSAGVWYILRSSDGSVDYASWGIAEDLPVAADYEGDGRTDVSVFRPSTGVWYVLKSSGGVNIDQWGLSSDVPVPKGYLPQ